MPYRSVALALLAVLSLCTIQIVAAGSRTTVFEVTGMHCSSCAEGIEAMVKRVDGVVRVEASYENHEAIVTFDPAKTSEKKIAEAIEKLGYKATPKKA